MPCEVCFCFSICLPVRTDVDTIPRSVAETAAQLQAGLPTRLLGLGKNAVHREHRLPRNRTALQTVGGTKNRHPQAGVHVFQPQREAIRSYTTANGSPDLSRVATHRSRLYRAQRETCAMFANTGQRRNHTGYRWRSYLQHRQSYKYRKCYI